MPLSKKRDKARKRIERAGLVQPVSNSDVVQPVEANQDILAALRKLMQPLDPAPRIDDLYIEAANRMDTPIYNPKKHHEGDVVRKWSNGKWIEVTVPALDMDGNVIGGD